MTASNLVVAAWSVTGGALAATAVWGAVWKARIDKARRGIEAEVYGAALRQIRPVLSQAVAARSPLDLLASHGAPRPVSDVPPPPHIAPWLDAALDVESDAADPIDLRGGGRPDSDMPSLAGSLALLSESAGAARRLRMDILRAAMRQIADAARSRFGRERDAGWDTPDGLAVLRAVKTPGWHGIDDVAPDTDHTPQHLAADADFAGATR